MPLPFPRIRPAVVAVGLAAGSSPSFAQEALDVDRYVEIVKRSHPAAAERAGLEQAAEAERRAAGVLPDPVFAFSWDRARPTDLPGAQGDETGYALSQTLPWPGHPASRRRRRRSGSRRPAGRRRRRRLGDRGPGATRLRAARGGPRPPGRGPRRPRRTRAPCATSSRGGRSWASRASPTASRSSVEWLRQQRQLAAGRARGTGGRSRSCARSRSSRCPSRSS